MSVNASLALAPPLSPLNSSPPSFYVECQRCAASVAVAGAYTLSLVLLLLPVGVCVLWLSLRGRGRPASHADVLARHSVTMDLVGVAGALLFTAGAFLPDEAVLMAGVFAYCLGFPGHTALHCLTCVEHYLAVVHPIAYLRLRQGAGPRAWRAGLAGVWLLSAGWVGVTYEALPDFPATATVCLLAAALTVVLFFFLSVLLALRNPGPGRGGRAGGRADPARRRALRVLSATVGVLLLRFLSLLVFVGVYEVEWAEPCVMCILIDCGLFLSLPSSLVLPAIFLLKGGAGARGRRRAERG